MNSICLSVAPNLRCEGLARRDNIAILIPPAVELVFSLTLAFTHSSSRSRKHWLLVLDGLSFFLLALADFLSHFITQASSTLVVFKIIDLVIAGASFIPIVTYTLFLFYFARSYLIDLLPNRFCRIITIVLFIVIPPIVAFNELGSLLGISYRSGVDPVTRQPVVQVGFPDAPSQRLALFFSSTTLALLTIFQAVLFSLGFIRLVRAFLDERRVESTSENPDAPDEVHLFRGLGWLVIGLKLGAIETVVGFANVSFGVVLTRRFLRCFARGAIIIGVIKGMNIVEDFVRFESEIKARRNGSARRSKRLSRFMISNPRNSTFREMSPQATAFHVAQREKRAGGIGPSPLVLGAESSHNAFNKAHGGDSTRLERVTVHYDGKTAPVLELRLSGLDIPVPPLPENIALAPVEKADDTWNSSYGAAPAVQNSDALPEAVTTALASGSSLPHFMPIMPLSARTTSLASDSLEVVREMAARFPNLPPRVIPGKSPLDHEVDADSDADWRSIARTRSLQRRQQQAESAEMLSPGNTVKRKAAPPPLDLEPGAMPERMSADVGSPFSPDTDDDSTVFTHTVTPDLTRMSSLEATLTPPSAFHGGSVFGSNAERLRGRFAHRVVAIEGKAAQGKDEAAFNEEHELRLARLRRELRASAEGGNDSDSDAGVGTGGSDEHVEIPWLHSDPLTELQAVSVADYPLVPTSVNDDDASEMVLDDAWRRAGLSRIKSVSQVRVRTTPRVQHSGGARGSLFAVEEEDLGLPESYEERDLSGVDRSMVKPARLDSGVLGEEDRRFVRQGAYI